MVVFHELFAPSLINHSRYTNSKYHLTSVICSGIIKIEKDALDALIRIFEAADNSGELLNYDEALDYNSLDLSWENGFSDYKADFITAIFDIIDIIHFRNVGVKSAQNDLRIAFNRIRRPAGSLAICWGIRRTSGTRNRHMSSESVLLALSDSFGKMLFSQGYLVFEYGIKTHA